MSIRQLIPSLGAELDELCARLSCVEELLGVGVLSRKNSNADESCRICGITWQLGAGPDERAPATRPGLFFLPEQGPEFFQNFRVQGSSFTSDKLAQIQIINQQKWPIGNPILRMVLAEQTARIFPIFDINKVLPTCATDKVKLMKYEIFTIITMTRPFVRLTSNEYVMTCETRPEPGLLTITQPEDKKCYTSCSGLECPASTSTWPARGTRKIWRNYPRSDLLPLH